MHRIRIVFVSITVYLAPLNIVKVRFFNEKSKNNSTYLVFSIHRSLRLRLDQNVGYTSKTQEKGLSQGISIAEEINDPVLYQECASILEEMKPQQQHEENLEYHGISYIHWCAKVKNEVEKLAYQLNEEAERTERPIRRLSKVMYGSTCADMQVDVMGECLSSIKHVVSEGRSVTSVAAEFRIAHSIVSRLWRQFLTTGTHIRGFSSGRPRGTTPADDRYIVLQARRNRRQAAGEIARHTTQAIGRPISRFTVTKRLHGGGLFARRPVRCVRLTPAHRRRRSLWCREHRNWRDNEWGRVLFTDESRFSLSSDSHLERARKPQ
ncbi:HTH_Tnp_Tc3_2 domain-containing protein [Trichonephila clavipes]|uniref:HTH_Tnp_Tc3_2 domain-containing protein n=1 Tax=Trichonephila clavipes TaxID=2585209 RepID=A0A8X6SXA6_TRICX|nr:HTH_Tnp_Tc3_2 domain-containing protein [Trichonephila clavipes]